MGFFDLIEDLKDYLSIFKMMISGDSGTVINVDGVSRPSVGKAVHDELNNRWSAISAISQNRGALKLHSELPAQPADKYLYEIWGDPVPEKNGLWGWSGSAWEVAEFDYSRMNYKRNSGSNFPMVAKSRDGSISTKNKDMVDAILDVKVLGAKDGKLYRIEWIGNGTEAFSDGDRYGFVIGEYDASNYDVDSSVGYREIHGIGDNAFPSIDTIDGVVSRRFACGNDDSIVIQISYFPNKIAGQTAAFNSAIYPAGSSWIIDPVCYYSNVDNSLLNQVSNDIDLLNNQLTDVRYLPLKNMSRNGQVWGVSNVVSDSIIDCTIYGAKSDKYYRIEWIGNGAIISSEPRYDILVSEYPRETFNSDSTIGAKALIKLADFTVGNGLVLPNGVTTQVLHSVYDTDITVVIKYDASLIPVGGSKSLNNSVYADYGSIVHPSNYIVEKYSESIGSVIDVNAKPLKVLNNDGSVEIIAGHGDEDCKVKIEKSGSNNLMAIYGYYIGPKKSGFNSLDWVKKTGTSTDWIGPLAMKALSNTNGNGFGWSGGNHDSSGSASGAAPSAVTESYSVYTEDGALNIGDSGEFNQVSITVVNKIYAHNTVPKDAFAGRFVLVETVSYLIKPCATEGLSVAVTVDLELLEDIEITTYYGMQAKLDGLDKYWFPGGMYQDWWVLAADLDTGSKDVYPSIDHFTAVSNDNKYGVVGWIDSNYGLTENGRSHVPGTDSLGLASVHSKLYHRLISGPVLFNSGEILSWRGGYVFSPVVNKNNANIFHADFFGQKLLICDSFSLGKQVLPVDQSFIGRPIASKAVAGGDALSNSVGASGLSVNFTEVGSLICEVS